MSDRILVMNEGRMVAEIPRQKATLESIGTAMTQHGTPAQKELRQ